MHFKIKTIKGNKYLYVIKNEWIDGKVVQVIQQYVGTADQVYDLVTKNKEKNRKNCLVWRERGWWINSFSTLPT